MPVCRPGSNRRLRLLRRADRDVAVALRVVPEEAAMSIRNLLLIELRPFGSLCFRQESRGSIAIHVTDPQGAVIPGASIIVMNTKYECQRIESKQRLQPDDPTKSGCGVLAAALRMPAARRNSR
jgi:hypothetical protein